MKTVGLYSLLAVFILTLTATNGGANGHNGAASAKATGEVVVTNVDFPARRHWFEFAAHEDGDAPFGKGFMNHQRLSADGTNVIREEFVDVQYVIVEGSNAWFAGPILYDSMDSNPTRWFVVRLYDGGKPRDHGDWMDFTRLASEGEAFDFVESMASAGNVHEVVSGNLMVH